MQEFQPEVGVLHAAMDGSQEELVSRLDRLDDHTLWDLQDVCLTLGRTIGNVILQRLEGHRPRPEGTVSIPESSGGR